MANTYKTPGVYVEEIPKLPPSVADVPTAIPAFIGYTAKATKGSEAGDLLNKPAKITSLIDYERIFGKGPELIVDVEGKIANVGFVLYDSIRLFYDNGGGICYIVSIGDYEATEFSMKTYQGGLNKVRDIDEVTLLVMPDAATLLEASDLGALQKQALKQCKELQDRFSIFDVQENGAEDNVDNILLAFRNNVGQTNADYGAAYYPYVSTVYKHEFTFKDVINRLLVNRTHLEYLNSIGYSNNKGTEDGGSQTKGKTKTPKGNDKSSYSEIEKSIIKAINDININKPDKTEEEIELEKSISTLIPGYTEILGELSREVSVIPPSGAIAGIYAQSDNFSGVWSAPANMSVNSIKGVSRLINNKMQEDMNVTSTGLSINAIRAFSGKGIMVWGARTLAGNNNEWRYVPVRRLFIYVEESVKKSTEWAVFSPNTQNTWTKVKSQIENFLINVWRAGGLAGSTPAEAFFVSVGLGVTMDYQDILEGRLIVEIGMAAVRPAEFIILRFSHKVQES